jgi:phosphoenolpyruvate phosphomutase
MIIARVESLVLEQGMDDAVERARAYTEAGADGILIHSAQQTPEEVFEFTRRYTALEKTVPIVVVPSTYSVVTEEQLEEMGIRIVIYANQLLRSAYPAMLQTAQTILRHHRAKETEDLCLPIHEVIKLIR